MAIQISGNTIVTDGKVLQNVTGFKTVSGVSILGSGDITASGDYAMRAYTSPATWTKPANLKAIKVTVVGGGGGSTPSSPTPGGGGGGAAVKYIPADSIPGPVVVTIGNGGTYSPAPTRTGNTSSFGTLASATGGSGTGTGGAGSNGTFNITGGSGSPAINSSDDASTSVPQSPPAGPVNIIFTFSITGGGKGGDSLLGYGGVGTAITINGSPSGFSNPPTRNATSGIGYGAGAGGAAGEGAGANGTSGIVVVEEFY